MNMTDYRFMTGDTVRFKSDKEAYSVSYTRKDENDKVSLVDLVPRGGGLPIENVPIRLIEQMPQSDIPPEVFKFYAGKASGETIVVTASWVNIGQVAYIYKNSESVHHSESFKEFWDAFEELK